MTDASKGPANRIAVVAMDGSEASEAALDFFVKNVYHEGFDVVLMYCVHHRAQNTYGSVWMPVEPHLVVHAYHEERKKGEEVCKKLKAKLDTYKIGGQVIQLDGGDPGHTIVQKCEELGASVIVVGSRGLGAIRRTLIGSVSDYILHHSNIPVFICKH
ncbi:unnamed protein product [Mytilus coruscus]|uniref:UspA domain-containing protein n=1 Tax=Mytilus coruscus TaxID=42192 RepID=A0A6J8F0S5_MYTCO|nr:unnamed protein product [Mytilus coruscus]